MTGVWKEFYSMNRTDRDRVNNVSDSVFSNEKLRKFTDDIRVSNKKSGISVITDTRKNSLSVIFDKLSKINIEPNSALLMIYKNAGIEDCFDKYNSFTKEEFLLCYNIYILVIAECMGFSFESEYEKNFFTEKREKFIENIVFSSKYWKLIQTEKRLYNLFSKYIVHLSNDTNPLDFEMHTAMYDTKNVEVIPKLMCAFSGKNIDSTQRFFVIKSPIQDSVKEFDICISTCNGNELLYADGMMMIISCYFSFGYIRTIINEFLNNNKEYTKDDFDKVIDESLTIDSKVNDNFISKFLRVILSKRTALRDIFE